MCSKSTTRAPLTPTAILFHSVWCQQLTPIQALQLATTHRLHPTNPLATTGGGYLFNSLNGQMTFTPNIIQDALIVNQVSEYKKGVLVGTSEREMTFIVKDNCTGTAPSASITSLNGATLSTDASGNVVNICKGAPLVTFNITINNPDGDTTFLTSSGVPASASLTFSNNGTPYPGASFSWSTDTLSPGIYSFFLQIKNNHCPVSNTQTIAYTIHVVNFPSIREVLVDPTQCIHQAAVNYDITWGFLPRTIKIVQGGTVIKTIIDSTGSDSGAVINDSLPAGNYIAIVSSDSICSASVSFTVADSGSLTVPDTSFSFCKGDPSSMLYITPLSASASVNWYSTDGTALSSPPVVNTSFAGTYSWYFIENYKSCTSGPVNATAVVHNLPNAQVIDIPSVVCYGDKVYLKASGGTQYTWTPTDIISSDTGGQYVVVLAPLSLYVKVTDQNDCSDTTSITYSDIQRCCNMSFPTAFTPNNDGHNDGFKVVTYGNMLYFNISIFNRFGQLVFTSNDPKKEWDGTFEGIPCELGSYFYFVDAKCLTGPKKFYQGDITLIR